MSSGDEPSNADEGSEEIQGPVSSDEIASFSVSTDDFSAQTNEEHKTTASSITETDANTNRDGSETASDDRKPSPKREHASSAEESEGQATSDEDINRLSSNTSTQNQESFPEILMRMLNTEAEAGRESIKWLPDGSGFEVLDQNALEKDILPLYFPSSCRFQSFIRRLYRWSFLQIGKRKSGHYIFANDSFQRDNDVYKKLKAKPRPRSHTRQEKRSITGTAQEVPSQQIALTQAQNHITSQLNSIINSYSNNPMMLSSLQSLFPNVTTSQLTYGVSQNHPNAFTSMPQHVPEMPSQPQPPHEGTQNQEQMPGSEIVDNVIRFLTQGQLAGAAYSSAPSLNQHPRHNMYLNAALGASASNFQFAPPNLAAMPQQGAGPIIQRQRSSNEYAGGQYNVDMTTTNTSVSSLEAQPQNNNEASESSTNDRKRRRSPSPKD